MMIDRHALADEPLREMIGRRLVGVAGHNHGADIQADAPECVDQTKHVQIVGDPQVPADLAFFDVVGVDHDDDFYLFAELEEHPHLAVGQKAWQDAGSVIIVKQLAAQLQVQLAAEMADPLQNVLGLQTGVLLVVKANLHDFLHSRVQKSMQNTRASPAFNRFSGGTAWAKGLSRPLRRWR